MGLDKAENAVTGSIGGTAGVGDAVLGLEEMLAPVGTPLPSFMAGTLRFDACARKSKLGTNHRATGVQNIDVGPFSRGFSAKMSGLVPKGRGIDMKGIDVVPKGRGFDVKRVGVGTISRGMDTKSMDAGIKSREISVKSAGLGAFRV